MRGHDQTSRRVRRRASPGVFFAVALLATSGAPYWAIGEEPVVATEGASASTALAHAREPVILAGQRVVTWTVGTQQWFLLSGRVSAFQDTEGLRADAAVARVTTAAVPGGTSYRVELYAERTATGDPAEANTFTPFRGTFETRSRVEVTQYVGGRPKSGADLRVIPRS